MAARIVQLNFKFGVSAADYAGTVKPMAEDFAAVPGLRWKVWLMNEKESEAGGIYFVRRSGFGRCVSRERPGPGGHESPGAQ